MNEYIKDLLPVLLRTLSDPSDDVVLLNLQVLSRISLNQTEGVEEGNKSDAEEAQFQMVLNAILSLFATDRQLLETRGSLIIRKLCVLLNAKSVYIRMADALSSYETIGPEDGPEADETDSLEFVSTMVQTLNLILLTAAELHELRGILSRAFLESDRFPISRRKKQQQSSHEGAQVFAGLFKCWCHNPVSTFSLCLLAQAYDLSFALVKKFSELDVTVGFLMQIDKLVQLLESPIFVHLRLQLLDVDTTYHAPLLKSCYGLLMLLPQSDAFRSLNERLTTVCNLRDNLGIKPSLLPEDEMTTIISQKGLSFKKLLMRFDEVIAQHKEAKEASQSLVFGEVEQEPIEPGRLVPSGAKSGLMNQFANKDGSDASQSSNGVYRGNQTVPSQFVPH